MRMWRMQGWAVNMIAISNSDVSALAGLGIYVYLGVLDLLSLFAVGSRPGLLLAVLNLLRCQSRPDGSPESDTFHKQTY